MLVHLPLLSILVWLGLGGGIAVFLTGGDDRAHLARLIALSVAVFSLILCLPLWFGFDTTTYHMQFVENHSWIPQLGIQYHLGVDGISMPLVGLTVITTLVVVLASWTTINKKIAQYLGAFLIMHGMMIGMFCALDSILFYIFWEGMLIPVFISIGVWGGANRTYASIKFFIFTFAGSALMLVALLYLQKQTHSFQILDFYHVQMNLHEQILIFIAFLLAFAVKIPMWPVHTWLPDAHTEAPAGGSVVLAALMLKMGVYGFLRFSLPITPDACQSFDWFMITLSLIAIVYIGFVAIVQTDVKRLIAYSSIAHMGFATLGTFMIFIIIRKTGDLSEAYMSLEGSMVQMVSHAFSTGAMFIAVGILYEQIHSRMIKDFGGVALKMPIFAAFFMLFAMANVGLPGTSGFVGEFMVLLSTFKASFWVTFLAASTLILSAAYTLWMYKRVFFGEVVHEGVAKLKDISGFDLSALALLGGLIIFLGVYPEPLLNVFHASVGHLLELSLESHF